LSREIRLLPARYYRNQPRAAKARLAELLGLQTRAMAEHGL